MVAYLPIEGGHIMLAERFVEPALSFAMGWNYCPLFPTSEDLTDVILRVC